MAITQSALAHALAHDLRRAVPPDAGILRAWVWSQHGYVDPERDYVELSILHDELDTEASKRLGTAIADMMNDRYPEVNKALYTFVSDGKGDLGLEDELRPGTEEIELHGE
jgi:hypothetical protein